MSYYRFNRKEILQKAKERYSKEKAAEYYLQNKEAIKEKSRDRYKNLAKEEKDKIKKYRRKRYQTARKTIFPKSWNIIESSKSSKSSKSKCHLSVNFLAEKKILFPITKRFKTRTFSNQ